MRDRAIFTMFTFPVGSLPSKTIPLVKFDSPLRGFFYKLTKLELPIK